MFILQNFVNQAPDNRATDASWSRSPQI